MPGATRRAALDEALAREAAVFGAPAPAPRFRRLRPRDWLAENARAFPPIQAGRYYIHGSHEVAPLPWQSLAIVIDAGNAFGTGEHPSTRGCLLALDALARRRRFRATLDMGCGAGLLAIAMAKTWRRPVVACDIDPIAADVARANAEANGVGGRVRTGQGDGYRAALVRRGAPYDLIVANILARPLAEHGLGPRRRPGAAGGRRPLGIPWSAMAPASSPPTAGAACERGGVSPSTDGRPWCSKDKRQAPMLAPNGGACYKARMVKVYAIDGVVPVVPATSFVHPTATLIGDVIIGAECYIGPGASLRGDFGRIIVGDGCNIQDTCVLHTFPDTEVVVEDWGHIGHGSVLHGCRVGRNSLIGMNAVIMGTAW